MSKKLYCKKFKKFNDLEKIRHNANEVCIIGSPETSLAKSVRENLLNYAPSYSNHHQNLCAHLIMDLSGRADNIEVLKLKILMWLLDTFRIKNILFLGYYFNEANGIYVMDAYVTLIAKDGSVGSTKFDSSEANWVETYNLYLDDPIYYYNHRIKKLLDALSDVQHEILASGLDKAFSGEMCAFESTLCGANESSDLLMAQHQCLNENQESMD